MTFEGGVEERECVHKVEVSTCVPQRENDGTPKDGGVEWPELQHVYVAGVKNGR